MIITIKKPTEVNIKTLVVKAEPRYWEDASVNGEEIDESGEGVPCKNGDLWNPEIDIETGKILNWEQGKTADIHFKVCDCCGWEIKDDKGEIVMSAEDGYVPDTLCPKDSGYGDYIIMDIAEDGQIQDWNFDISNFNAENED